MVLSALILEVKENRRRMRPESRIQHSHGNNLTARETRSSIYASVHPSLLEIEIFNTLCRRRFGITEVNIGKQQLRTSTSSGSQKVETE